MCAAARFPARTKSPHRCCAARLIDDTGTRGLGSEHITVADGVLERIAVFADGDAARRAQHARSSAARATAPSSASGEGLRSHASSPKNCSPPRCNENSSQYDKSGEEHYNIISALHKSVRNSDADAALYWLARMLGDPAKIPCTWRAAWCGKLASEDIGLADPAALSIAGRRHAGRRFCRPARRQSLRWPKQPCIWRWLPSRMRFMPVTAKCKAICKKLLRSRCHCIFATRSPG